MSGHLKSFSSTATAAVFKRTCVPESNGVKVMTHLHSTGTETAGAGHVAVNVSRQNNQTTVEALYLRALCTLGLTCESASWNSLLISTLSSCINICRQRLHAANDWL